MRRREFLGLVGGAAATVPLAAAAQQPGRVRRIGVLMGTEESEPEGQSRIAAFRQGLRALGWVEGRNIKIEYRWSSGPLQAAYAAELIAMKPEVIVTNGTPFLDTVHKGTRAIPVVFVLSNDPLASAISPA